MNHYAKLLETICKEGFKSNLLNKWQYSILNTRINAIQMLQKAIKLEICWIKEKPNVAFSL